MVYNDELINKKERKNIISQYLLLNDEKNRFEDVISIDTIGEAKLYLREFKGEDEDIATNNCVMIRYPYMKIRELPKISTLPCSALCIIENNKLNTILRNVENPQHTSWEFNRIDDPAERTEVKAIYDELINQIKSIITQHLLSSDNIRTDLEGAGEYIGDVDKKFGAENGQKGFKKAADKPKIMTKKVKITTTNINASIPDKDGDGVLLDIGENDDDGEAIIYHDGEHNEKEKTPNSVINQSESESNKDGHIILKHHELRGMVYRFFCLDKKENKYGITFVSDYDENEVRLELNLLDDYGKKYPVEILDCKIGDNIATIENKRYVKFSIKHGEKVKMVLITNQEELFSGEVKVYAYR